MKILFNIRALNKSEEEGVDKEVTTAQIVPLGLRIESQAERSCITHPHSLKQKRGEGDAERGMEARKGRKGRRKGRDRRKREREGRRKQKKKKRERKRERERISKQARERGKSC